MTPILAPRNAEVLERLSRSAALLAFDFDGTLAPIVPRRQDAAMTQGTRKLFAELCDLYPCAVLSGRSLADVSGRLAPANVKYTAGNHGLEPFGREAQEVDTMRQVLADLHRLLGETPGIDVEDKGLSLSLHYRQADNPAAARRAIDRALYGLRPLVRLIDGHFIVNILPAHAPGKGDALARLHRAEGATASLYVGDDITDEDVFGLHEPWLVTVRVGAFDGSAADYFLESQAEIDALLEVLVGLRRGRRADREIRG